VRDRLKPTVEGFDAFHSPRLSPAEGLESAANLFTAPPIEALELLKELGDIAAASLSSTEEFMGHAENQRLETLAQTAPAPAPTGETRVDAELAATEAPPAAAKAAPTSDERLMDALLEYHRLRGPKLGARTAPRPSADSGFSRTDSTLADPGERFASVEIPVVQDFVPKSSPGGNRSSRPIQTILKPKPRP
jgi:hypothetical protein